METIAHHFKLILIAVVLAALVGCKRSSSNAESGGNRAIIGPSAAPLVVTPHAPSAEPSARASINEPSRGLWWTVRSGQSVLYLLGSIHVARADLYPLDQSLERAFAAADALVLEVDLNAANLVSIQMKMMQAGRYPPGDSLDRHISAATMKRLEAEAPRDLLSAGVLRQFRPWFVATTILATQLEALGYEPRYGLDSHFADRAKGNKAVTGLETIEEQVQVFSQLPPDVELLMLEETLDEAQYIEAQMKRVVGAWRRGDPRPIEEEMIAPMRTPRYAPVLEAVLLSRNRRWVEKLVGFLQTAKSYFVVVGAAHLVGQGSVVDLLRARGYEVVKQ